MKSISCFPLVILSVFCLGCTTQNYNAKNAVNGVTNPVISLNGEWKITTTPPENFQDKKTATDNWDSIMVPGEAMMQGVLIDFDKPFVYKTDFAVPEDYKNKRIFIEFNGVYSFARVWVNGHYIRDHWGGFTIWTADITEHVTPGEEAELTIEVTDRIDELSYGSGYAHHQIGGILRNVNLIALPEVYMEKLSIETDFDEQYHDATLKISCTLSEAQDADLKLSLFDDKGDKISIPARSFEVKGGKGSIEIPVQEPKKWDAEHPNLYTLVAELWQNGRQLQTKSQKIGFREIEISGVELLVNGMPVKLRGACRHDIHPELGRTTTAEQDWQDALLAKQANINFIRTSHYPPSRKFVEYCDQLGIYVEAESAVCFSQAWKSEPFKEPEKTMPKKVFRHLSQMQEMVYTFENSPSVIIWSIGNESFYDEDFEASQKWVKQYDPSRPLIFSYPGSVPDSVAPFWDILSMHYPNYKGDAKNLKIEVKNFENANCPVLFDEWTHVPCYNRSTLVEDPNVRNQWGQSLDLFWSTLFEKKSGLGGAIWGYIDETFMLPDDLSGFEETWGWHYPTKLPGKFVNKTVGYGEWGIIDTYRRKKPEWWNTKKAYSPAKIMKTKFDYPGAGKELIVPVFNRFDHTNFDELVFEANGVRIHAPDIDPHQKGELAIPASLLKKGKQIFLTIHQDTLLVDACLLSVGENKSGPAISVENVELKVSENKKVITVSRDGNKFHFSKQNGRVKFVKNGNILIQDGPFVHLRTRSVKKENQVNQIKEYPKDWAFKSIKSVNFNDSVLVSVEGNYNKGKVIFEYLFYPSGIAKMNYKFEEIVDIEVDSQDVNRTGFLGASSFGGFEAVRECGVCFSVPATIDSLSWEQNAYWSYYPENHLGANKHKTPVYSTPSPIKRQKPRNHWAMDTRSIYYHSKEDPVYHSGLTNMAKGLKENILSYNLHNSDTSLKVTGTGNEACRINKLNDRELELYINQVWDYVNIGWGNYYKNIPLQDSYQGFIQIN